MTKEIALILYLFKYIKALLFLLCLQNNIFCCFYQCASEQARSHGGHSGAEPPIFVVPRKICFKHRRKTKILTLRNVFWPPNLETWLRVCIWSAQRSNRLSFHRTAAARWTEQNVHGIKHSCCAASILLIFPQ